MAAAPASLPDSDFAPLAPRYDELRPYTPGDGQRLARMVDLVGLRAGDAALEIGCGTGRLALPLAEMTGAHVTGVEPEPAMLARARAKPAPSRGAVTWLEAPAERLPLPAESFRLVYLNLVAHLLSDPAAAWGEAARVLRPGGLLSCWTFAGDHFRRFHLSPYFPSLVVVDEQRFPPVRSLLAHFRRVGLEAGHESFIEVKTLPAGRYLEMVEGRAISTLHLIPADEFEAGLARLRRRLGPDPARPVNYRLRWRHVWGTRPPA